MKKILTLAFVTLVTLSQAQHKEVRKIGKLEGVAVSSSIEAKYIVSDRNEVVVEVEDPDHLKKIETVIEYGKLHIRYKSFSTIRTKKPNRVTVYSNGKLSDVEVSSSASLRIEDPIKTSEIDIDVNSSGKLFASNITAEKVDLEITSSGRFDARINANFLEVEASSSGKLNLLGQANRAIVDISSSANVNMTDMRIKTANVDASSSAKVTINVSEELNADVSSSGKVYYVVKPKKLKIDKSSGGQVEQK
ncbi:head GIN domain-containing protein [Sphingobacterium sp. LRF_L2]|uniref:head GIN domain-containing protein n=1 Tax=Sphingobacterium sp. LRF_L2 TaxID=3369421 RepID=UPI003F5EBE83